MSKSSKILLIFTIVGILISLAVIGLSLTDNSDSKSDMNANAPISQQSPF